MTTTEKVPLGANARLTIASDECTIEADLVHGTVTWHPPVPAHPDLADGSVTPVQGDTETEFVWSATYADPQGRTADYVCLALVWPDRPPGQDPREWLPMATTDGSRYTVSRKLPAGEYAYQFEYGVGGTNYLSLGAKGPVVVDAPPPVPEPEPDPPTDPAASMGPLRVHPTNPRYFAAPDGRAVFLTGSHTWNNVQDMTPPGEGKAFDFAAYLDWLQGYGHTFTRLWRWELTRWTNDRGQVLDVSPHPWPRTGPGTANDGKPKFDLSRGDDAYFDRLRSRVAACRERSLYCSVMLFEGCRMYYELARDWPHHPFHPTNNVQGLDGGGLAYFQLTDSAVLELQTAYVQRVIEAVGDLDNLIWEIANETTRASADWQAHWMRFIRTVEGGRPLQHPIGTTPLLPEENPAWLFASPADWIAPQASGSAEWTYQTDPAPADGRKVVFLDTDHLWGLGGTPEWAWKAFTRGYYPLFMDPYDGLVWSPGTTDWGPLRQALGNIARLAAHVDLSLAVPSPNLASTGY